MWRVGCGVGGWPLPPPKQTNVHKTRPCYPSSLGNLPCVATGYSCQSTTATPAKKSRFTIVMPISLISAVKNTLKSMKRALAYVSKRVSYRLAVACKSIVFIVNWSVTHLLIPTLQLMSKGLLNLWNIVTEPIRIISKPIDPIVDLNFKPFKAKGPSKMPSTIPRPQAQSENSAVNASTSSPCPA